MEHKLLIRYHRNEHGAYVIDIRIRHLDDLFNPMDPDPIPERDINDDIVKKLYDELIIFPKNVQVDVRFHLPRAWRRIKNLDENIRAAMMRHFEYTSLSSKLHMRRRLRKGLRQLTIALILFIGFISLSTFITFIYETSVTAHVVAEGFFVLSWVTLWRPIETLFYEWLPLFEEHKRYARIQKMNVHFEYTD
ncbi:MAG: hypothetical protein V1725_07045 [archaeon]